MLSMKGLLFVSLGAILGATFRHVLTLCLNPLLAFFSLGTFIANGIGCFLMGILLAIYWQSPISMEWRLFLVTGFLGSLTTFSAFSAEIMTYFMQQKWLEGMMVMTLHLLLGLSLMAFGIFLVHQFI